MKTTLGRAGLGGGLLVTLVASLVAVFAGSTWPGRPAEAGADEGRTAAGRADDEAEAIRGIVARYARSIDDADTALAAEVWSNTPDVSFIHPRGHERGWEEVKRNLYEKAMGATFSERKLSTRDVVVHVYGDAAWAEFYWDFTAKLKVDGSAVKTRGRETQVYRKRDGRWALVHVHYSGMPVTGERRGF
jgi:ketosteroid isomerase-like protein